MPSMSAKVFVAYEPTAQAVSWGFLRHATFEPAYPTPSYDHKSESRFGKTLSAWRTWYKHRHLWQVLAVVALFLPSKPPMPTPIGTLEKITMTNTVKVATTDDTLFSRNSHLHGLGYDIANRYARNLGAKLEIVHFDDDHQALAALNAGTVDVLVSDHWYDKTQALSMSADCQGGQTQFVVNRQSFALMQHAKSYLCSNKARTRTDAMDRFYKQSALDDYSVNHFKDTFAGRLPLYQNAFEDEAKKYNHDWELLAVISYQESHLNPEAISPTGVQGIMMLTQDTARAMGVNDRTNPIQSIQGGAKYLNKLNRLFSDIPEPERLWFVLSAYNMGPNAVKSIQEEIQASGGNPKLWSDFYAYLIQNAHKNSRYTQCIHYVTNIRSYLETLGTS